MNIVQQTIDKKAFTGCSSFKLTDEDTQKVYITPFSFYPNPANDNIDFTYHNLDKSMSYNLVIYNIFGQEEISIVVDPRNAILAIPIYGLSDGIYLLTITQNERSMWTDKLIKVE